ncbi:major histocompatibility complex class I-related protein 1-like [Mixophyes fleayi]|uniref:major histocompatibility complex class I-related protein 1-like n=1 Tax=Mixophyes fleayi TaxID=3061075 RepID=UPI003F4E2919
MYPLFLLILGVSGVYSDSHSLRHYYTGVSGTGWGLPEVSIAGYVDDQQIGSYNSDSRLAQPRVPWIDKLEPEFWDRQTQRGKDIQTFFNYTMRTAMSQLNRTGGSHTFQAMHGCELTDDGSIAVYDQYGYDGEDAMYLDTKTWLYKPTVPEAQYTAQIWNSPDVRQGEIMKNYLQRLCAEWLKDVLQIGRDVLEKRVTPEVKVTGQKLGRVTVLHCQVYGFHPRAVDVRWMKNKQEEVPLDEAIVILPNPDGTYQTRVTAEVPTGEEDSYSCEVNHSRMKKSIRMSLNVTASV